MNFGEALEQAKSGRKIARAGWNGKGMWVCFMPPVTINEALVNGRTKVFRPTGDLRVGGYFVMSTADGTWQPGWLASQADMLADDWEAFGEPFTRPSFDVGIVAGGTGEVVPPATAGRCADCGREHVRGQWWPRHPFRAAF